MKRRSHHRAALIVASIAVAVGLAFRGYVIARPTATLTARYLADDYFYYLGVASHIASGNGSSFDGGLTFTNGYQPLFLWLLTGVFALGAGKGTAIHIGLAIQAVAAAAASLLVYALLAKRGAHWAGAGACGLLSVNLFFVLPTLTGFEMALALATMMLAVVAWQRRLPAWIVGLLCGLSVLARVDTIVMAGVFGLLLLAERRFRELAQLIGGVLLVAGPFALWNALAFGHPLPDSGVVKAHYRGMGAVGQAAVTAATALPRVLLPGRAVAWADQHAPALNWLAAALMLAVTVRAGWRREHREIVAIACGLSLSYFALIDPHETGALVRYLFPVWAIVAMVLVGSLPPAAIVVLLFAHAADAAVYARWDYRTAPAASFVGAAHVLAPPVIAREVSDAAIGSFDAGALGYFSPRPVINLDGLANHDIVQLQRRCGSPYDACVREYLRSKGISVLAGGTSFGWTTLFPGWTAWERIWESPPLVDGSRLVIVRLPERPATP